MPDLDSLAAVSVSQSDATDPGDHRGRHAATDKTGYTQTSVQAPEAPNGASGYPVAQINVYQS